MGTLEKVRNTLKFSFMGLSLKNRPMNTVQWEKEAVRDWEQQLQRKEGQAWVLLHRAGQQFDLQVTEWLGEEESLAH